MPSNNSLVITDATCLIVLNKIGLLDILPQLFDFIITTPEICQEYGETPPDWLGIVPVEDPHLIKQFSQIIDAGEASAFALANEIKYDYLIIDDLQARKLAEKLGFNIVETLGILLKAKQNGMIPFLRPVLERLEKTNFRTSNQLIEKVLKDAGE